MVAIIYIDDVTLLGNDIDRTTKIKVYIDKCFSIKDFGLLKFFLRVEVAKASYGMVLSQRKYTLNILADCGLKGCQPSVF